MRACAMLKSAARAVRFVTGKPKKRKSHAGAPAAGRTGSFTVKLPTTEQAQAVAEEERLAEMVKQREESVRKEQERVAEEEAQAAAQPWVSGRQMVASQAPGEASGEAEAVELPDEEQEEARAQWLEYFLGEERWHAARALAVWQSEVDLIKTLEVQCAVKVAAALVKRSVDLAIGDGSSLAPAGTGLRSVMAAPPGAPPPPARRDVVTPSGPPPSAEAASELRAEEARRREWLWFYVHTHNWEAAAELAVTPVEEAELRRQMEAAVADASAAAAQLVASAISLALEQTEQSERALFPPSPAPVKSAKAAARTHQRTLSEDPDSPRERSGAAELSRLVRIRYFSLVTREYDKALALAEGESERVTIQTLRDQGGRTEEELMEAGFAANKRGEHADARKRFCEAYERFGHRVEAQLSGANMALKMGDAALAEFEYQQLLLRSDLSGALRKAVVEKLAKASMAIKASEQDQRPWLDKLFSFPDRKEMLASVTAFDAHHSSAEEPQQSGFQALRSPRRSVAHRVSSSIPAGGLLRWQRRMLPPTADRTTVYVTSGPKGLATWQAQSSNDLLSAARPRRAQPRWLVLCLLALVFLAFALPAATASSGGVVGAWEAALATCDAPAVAAPGRRSSKPKRKGFLRKGKPKTEPPPPPPALDRLACIVSAAIK